MAVCRVQAATVIYDDMQFVTNNTTETKKFNVAPGLYKATLVDYESPDPFHVLSLGLTQGTTIYGFLNGTDSFTFNVLTNGILEAHLVAWPNDPKASFQDKTGLFSVEILGLMPVPLPSALWLFLSATVGMVGIARRDGRLGAT
jgi:hypothetical protein